MCFQRIHKMKKIRNERLKPNVVKTKPHNSHGEQTHMDLDCVYTLSQNMYAITLWLMMILTQLGDCYETHSSTSSSPSFTLWVATQKRCYVFDRTFGKCCWRAFGSRYFSHYDCLDLCRRRPLALFAVLGGVMVASGGGSSVRVIIHLLCAHACYRRRCRHCQTKTRTKRFSVLRMRWGMGGRKSFCDMTLEHSKWPYYWMHSTNILYARNLVASQVLYIWKPAQISFITNAGKRTRDTHSIWKSVKVTTFTLGTCAWRKVLQAGWRTGFSWEIVKVLCTMSLLTVAGWLVGWMNGLENVEEFDIHLTLCTKYAVICDYVSCEISEHLNLGKQICSNSGWWLQIGRYALLPPLLEFQ